MARYKQYIKEAGLSLEKETENVPDDGRYHLRKSGEIIASFKTLQQGLKRYKDELEKMGYKPTKKVKKKADLVKEATEGYLLWAESDKAASYRSKKSGRFH